MLRLLLVRVFGGGGASVVGALASHEHHLLLSRVLRRQLTLILLLVRALSSRLGTAAGLGLQRGEGFLHEQASCVR